MRRRGPLRRVGIKRGPTQLRRVRRLSPVSKKRELEAAERTIVRLRVLARDGRCCVAGALVPSIACRGPLDVHEVIPRSAWREGYLVDDNCVTICRAHHDWVGDHPEAAHGFGLHGYSWERPPA